MKRGPRCAVRRGEQTGVRKHLGFESLTLRHKRAVRPAFFAAPKAHLFFAAKRRYEIRRKAAPYKAPLCKGGCRRKPTGGLDSSVPLAWWERSAHGAAELFYAPEGRAFHPLQEGCFPAPHSLFARKENGPLERSKRERARGSEAHRPTGSTNGPLDPTRHGEAPSQSLPCVKGGAREAGGGIVLV